MISCKSVAKLSYRETDAVGFVERGKAHIKILAC